MPKKELRTSTRGGSRETQLRPGDGVRTIRGEPGKGTWKKYDGRIGVVQSVNRQQNQDWRYVEVGVAFTNAHHLVWFRADELIPHEVPGWYQPAILDNSDIPDMRRQKE